ncbi:MAG: class I SAM-dependent methyltransferase [Candidatus Omnitrophica bacterium]|nr:class I SAM-dependent methyltransferase [Candidatus Omnitrophota bacterium]MDD5774606.1 class I SAM-dependent methyltransferase [Candidatus Omnitrophota bacterium]
MDPEIAENHKRYLERKELNKSFGYDIDREREFILEQAQPVSGKILEAGTGKGHFALTLAKAGYRFVTFDISPEEQRFAKLNLAYAGLENAADFRIENAERTGFADNSFDAVFSVNVLHHLRNAYQVIDELLRLVSSGGKLVLADFTPEGLKIMDRIHGLEGRKHEVGEICMDDARSYLIKKGCRVKSSQSACQCVLVARKGSV